MGYSPWDDLGSRPEICCDTRTVELPSGGGWWLPDVAGIVLDRRMNRVERRCALAHELRHVDHGDHQVAHVGPDGPRQARRQEDRADRAAARRLIPMQSLIDAVRAHPHDPHTVAETLDVTPHVLAVRLRHLHHGEKIALRDVMAEHVA